MNSSFPNDSGTRPNMTVYCNLVGMALQNKMPWEMLENTLDCIIPSFEESKQVIKILLKELENLHLKLITETIQGEGSNDSSTTELEINDEINDSNESIETNNSQNIESNSLDALEEKLGNDVTNQFYEFIGDHEEQLQTKEEPNPEEVEQFSRNDEIIDTSEASKIHWKVSYECKICKKTFKKVVNLKEHERTHAGEQPYKCQTCNKRYKDRGTLRLHEKIHNGVKPHVCKICNKGFVQKVHMQKHEIIHTGEKPFECKICKKTFNRKSTLQKHDLIHTGEVPYGCDICHKRFKERKSLKNHEKRHKMPGEVAYKGKTNKKIFNEINDLKKHEIIHSGELPFECKICKKGFTDRGSLKKHERIHSGPI